jgi:hypothetical protein
VTKNVSPAAAGFVTGLALDFCQEFVQFLNTLNFNCLDNDHWRRTGTGTTNETGWSVPAPRMGLCGNLSKSENDF